MRIALVLALVLGLGATAQVTLFPAAPPAEVLGFLQEMEISPELKTALAPVLGAGLSTRRASSQVALPFLRQLSVLPASCAEEALAVVHRALERGFIVDALMNDVLKVLLMGQPWEAVMTNLQVRYNLLVASQYVLVQYGIIGVGPQGPGGPLLPQDRLVVEVAGAVGAWVIGVSREPLEEAVRARFTRLRGSLVDPADVELVDRLLGALTPELVQQIASRAYGP